MPDRAHEICWWTANLDSKRNDVLDEFAKVVSWLTKNKDMKLDIKGKFASDPRKYGPCPAFS